MNLEDALDWAVTAGNNGTTRRVMYSYADLSGMKKIKPKSCADLNSLLRQKMMVFFNIFRTHYPANIIYHFGEEAGNGDQPRVEEMKDEIGDALSPEQLNEVFDGEDYNNENDPPKLKHLLELAIVVVIRVFFEILQGGAW